MLSLVQAIDRRGNAGLPLPTVFQALEEREARICRGQLTLVVGPPAAGKSLLTANLLVKMGVPSLALLLDQDQLTAASRFASILTGDRFHDVKNSIESYRDVVAEGAGHIRAAFKATEMEDIKLQMAAYEQRFGEPPDVLLVDNAGNLSSGYDNEWAVLKALFLELDEMARDEQVAVIVCHHASDMISCDPAQRDKILGKVSQYPRLIFSVGFNEANGQYKIAILKNSSGRSDPGARNPVTLWADPARMSLTEQQEPVHPQLAMVRSEPGYAEVRTLGGGWRG